MAQSAHAYVRGSTVKFCEWLESSSRCKLPEGPSVWICGDCHVGNLGPLADAKGHVVVQIRDLDQTVIGNPAHDLIRLGLSLASAARGSDLPGVTTARILEELVAGYQSALLFETEKDKSHRPKSIQTLLAQSTRRRWQHLAEERLDTVKPTIPLGKRFWALTPTERSALSQMFASDSVKPTLISLRGRAKEDDPIELLDAAYWMKGCSSLGRLRFAVLVGVGKDLSSEGALCLMDIKEAVRSAAPCCAEAEMSHDDAMRVVEGAQHLSPALGERMLAARFLDKAVFLRELLPQDLKLEIDKLTREEAMKVARYLAMVVGKAHARQMSPGTREKWRDELARNHSSTLDAPSWLWSSVVELVASHEAAYLDHCRKYAMESNVSV